MLRPSIQYGFATPAPFVCLRCRLQRSNHGLLRRHSTRVSALEHVYLSDAGPELASPLSKKVKIVETSGQDDGNPQIARNPTATRDTKLSTRPSHLVRTHISNSTLPTYRPVEAVTFEDGNSSQVSAPDRKKVAQMRHTEQMFHLSRTARRQTARKVASKSDLVKKFQAKDALVKRFKSETRLVKKVKSKDALVRKFKSEDRLAKKVKTIVTRQNTTEKTKPGKVKAAEKETERLSAKEEFSDGGTSKSVAEVMTARSSGVRRSRPRARPKSPQEELTSLKNDKRAEENSVESSTLRLEAITTDQPPVPSLAYGLDRVLFNPGVHHLRDPRSRIYNFDPYLEKLMPVAQFDFNTLRQFSPPSKDPTLTKVTQDSFKKYLGSTSSMTGMLKHFHFLLSSWRGLNLKMLSKDFPAPHESFTKMTRIPEALFLKYRKNGTYAIDADKEFDGANILSMMGKYMEKLLTVDKESFERHRVGNSDKMTEEDKLSYDSFHYSTIGDFVIRSQLDAHDPRIPGTGMFDLKTRAVIPIRMDTKDYTWGMDYEIRSLQGEWESFEREYHDMIRSTMLKYSLQVRMGRMDGIFVAYHNIARIFGFQYIGLDEMDRALHGQSDRSLGDQEFLTSLYLLNKVFDRAVEKFPEQSIRFYFETREVSTPFMYIFAEPMTEEEVEEIQSKTKQDIFDWEQRILGLKNNDADTPETLSMEDAQAGNDQVDLTGNLGTQNEGTQNEDDATRRTETPVVEQVLVSESSSGKDAQAANESVDFVENAGKPSVDDDPLRTGVAESEQVLVLDGSFVKKIQAGNDSVEVMENAVKPNFDEDQLRTELDDLEQVLKLPSAVSTDEGYMDANAVETPQVVNGDEALEHDKHAEKAQTEQSGEQEDIATEENIFEDADTTKSTREAGAISPTPEVSEPYSSNSSGDIDFLSTLESSTEDNTSAGPLLAMILKTRSTVNSKHVTRASQLDKESQWAVHYSLDEIEKKGRAWTLYGASKDRRRKSYEDLASHKEEGALDDYYRKKLKEVTAKSKAWRVRFDREEEEEENRKRSEKDGKAAKRREQEGSEMAQKEGDVEKDDLTREDVKGEAVEKRDIERQNVEKQDVEREDDEKKDIEKQDVEKQDVEREDVEKQAIEKQDIEKQDVEKQAVEKHDDEKPDVEKHDVEKHDVEKHDVEKHDVEKQDVEARDVEARDVEAQDVEAQDIEARDVEARDVEKREIQKEEIEQEEKHGEETETEKDGKEKEIQGTHEVTDIEKEKEHLQSKEKEEQKPWWRPW